MKKSIMLVDDGRSLKSLLENDLYSNSGYELTTAANGLHAYQKLRGVQGSFDLMIFNLDMSGLKGIDLLKKLRLELRLATPVLIITENKSRSLLSLATRLRVAGLIFLPMSTENILDKVSEILNDGAHQSSSESGDDQKERPQVA